MDRGPRREARRLSGCVDDGDWREDVEPHGRSRAGRSLSAAPRSHGSHELEPPAVPDVRSREALRGVQWSPLSRQVPHDRPPPVHERAKPPESARTGVDASRKSPGANNNERDAQQRSDSASRLASVTPFTLPFVLFVKFVVVRAVPFAVPPFRNRESAVGHRPSSERGGQPRWRRVGLGSLPPDLRPLISGP